MEEKEKARRDLEATNVELAESQKALSDALAVAEHANRAKTEFLNNMSHDIRTPMNAIVGFTGLATTNIDNREQVLDYLGKISVSSQHLLSLINDVLDMSRIESGKVTIEETDVHLPEMINDLRTIIHSNIASKQLELFIDTQDVQHEDIITDKLRLSQVLLNILSNAIKFTPRDGIIGISTKFDEDEKKVYVSVEDSGSGIPEDKRDRVFESFYKVDPSRTESGFGLGLYICREIIAAHGEKIWAEQSEELGGAKFIYTLNDNAPEDKDPKENP